MAFGAAVAALVPLAASRAPHAFRDSAGLVDEGDRQLRSGLFDLAERSFRQALAHDPQSGGAHGGLARVLAARGDTAAAHGEAEIAVALLPDAAEVQFTLAAVRGRGGDTRVAAEALARYLATPAMGDAPLRRARARAYLEVLRAAGDAPLRVVPAAASRTVPFAVVQDKVVIKASVNGRVPTDVVVDTGAEHLVLSATTVDQAGLRRLGGTIGDGSTAMTLVDSFDVAGLTIRRVPAFVRAGPLRVVRNRSGDAFSPVALGLSAIIDYERRELTLASRLPFEPADVELPLYVWGLPVVVGASGGEAVSLVLDTGADASAIASGLLPRLHLAPEARRIPMRLFDAAGDRVETFLLTPGPDLVLGAIRWRQLPVLVRSWPDVQALHGFEMGGLLGHDVLRRYRVSIDLARRVVRLKRQQPERPTSG